MIASTTLDEGKLPDADAGHIVLIEMIGGMKRNPNAGMRWHETRQSGHQRVGAKTLWHGRCDHHILGTATPGIEDALVTWFPNPIAFVQVLRTSQKKDHPQNIRPYLAYTACYMEFLPELH